MFQKCKKEGIINKNARWDVSEIFPKKYWGSAANF